ncbi:MAG: hypothetical protein HRU38_21495 [Saccharospirillaceae bacterium]|nr:hypothetical protein [Pseudomonadales bacterium]NRB81205.1 hypothetical protein [Saccharospirillaceae bacterium]
MDYWIIGLLLFNYVQAKNYNELVFSNYEEVYLINEDFPDLLIKAFNNAGYQLSFEDHTIKNAIKNANSGLLDGVILTSLNDYSEKISDLIPIPVIISSEDVFVFFTTDLDCPESFNDLSNYTMLHYTSANWYQPVVDRYNSPNIKANNILDLVNIIKYTNTIDYLLVNSGAFKYLSDLTGDRIKRCFDEPITHIIFKPFLHKKHQNKLYDITIELEKIMYEYRVMKTKDPKF